MPKNKGKRKGGGAGVPGSRKVKVSLRQRVANIRLGDIGEAIGGACEGIGHVTGFNQEIKRLDIATNSAVVTFNGSVTSSSLIAEGNDFNQRDGHSVKAIGMELRAQASANSAAGIGGVIANTGRLILFMDLEQQGVQPTPAQLLEIVGFGTTPCSPFQHDNTERFVILDDWFFAVGVGGPMIATHQARIPLDSHIRYSGAAATDAAAREGHLYVCLIGDEAVNGPVMDVVTRLAYVDN
jgi:hypothetical protein